MKSYLEQLLTAAADGALVLTANKRLARYLRRRYDERMQASGRKAWPAPAIHSADAWLAQRLATVDESWRLLSAGAAQRLWEQVVEADTADSELGLLQVAASARRAREAHELLVEYRADCNGHPLTDDHRAFLRWREHFLAACAAGDWLDPATDADRVIDSLSSGNAPPALLLVGFDELPPRLQRLAAAALRLGGRVGEMPAPTAPVGDLLRLPCRDAADEVRQSARWARALLEAGEERIGIIVPNLAAYQGLIERIFREEIDPAALLASSEEEARFNLTLGAPLAQQGPVAAALEILACGPQMSLEAASLLLRTSYLGGSQSEEGCRSLLDRNLRSLRSESFSLSSLARLARAEQSRQQAWQASRSPVMAGILEALGEAAQQRGRHLPGDWAVRFSRQLEKVGWPGERPLDSRDYQVVRDWREKLLPQFTALDAISRPLGRGEALGLLRRLAGEQAFQAETPEAGLQVCGALEAGGLDFDHLWVLGLHEDAWPPPARPNPFLPARLQAARGMPHADAAREAAFARRIMARLEAAAPRVVFSHPLQEGGCPLRPSPLIADLPPGTVHLAESHAPQQACRVAGPEPELLTDEMGPPLREGEIARGGTAILKDQALCPFRAFAHHRLAAQALEQPAPGLDPATRGSLVHAVLEKFWDRTESHAALCALSEAALRERVGECVTMAIESHFAQKGARPPEPLLAIEKDRLQRLTEEWLLTVERQRTPFTSLEREQEHQERFGGLIFRTKVDRIDALDDGRRVIIDYKTGRVDLDDLLGERLLEPQLPIYGIGEGGAQLAAVAIAALRRGKCALKGVASDDDVLPRTPALAGSKLAEKHGLSGWEDLLGRWRCRLEALGRDFADGVATVDPVDVQKACRTCDLASLCRVAEAAEPLAGAGEEP